MKKIIILILTYIRLNFINTSYAIYNLNDTEKVKGALLISKLDTKYDILISTGILVKTKYEEVNHKLDTYFKGKQYYNIGEVAYSIDKKLSFSTRNPLNKKWYVIYEGKPGKEYESVSKLKFSNDGKILYYGASDGINSFTIVNGVEFKSYTAISGFDLTISPSGHNYVIVMPKEKENNNLIQYIIKDGKKIKLNIKENEKLNKIGYLINNNFYYITKDSNYNFYIYLDGNKKKLDIKKDLIIDGEKVFPGGIIISPDGKKITYTLGIPDWGGTYIVNNGKISKSKYSKIINMEYSINGDLYYLTREKKGDSIKNILYKNGISILEKDSIGNFKLAPNGESYYYDFSLNNGNISIINNGVQTIISKEEKILGISYVKK